MPHESVVAAVLCLDAMFRLHVCSHQACSACTQIVASREIPMFYEAEDAPSPTLLYPLLGVPAEEVARVTAAAAAGAKGGPSSGGGASIDLSTVARGKGAFIDRVRASAMFLLAADAAPLGNDPPRSAAGGGEGGSTDVPSGAWGSTTPAATRAFHEVASILRASAAAHVAESQAAASTGGGGGFLSGGFWDSSSSNTQAQVQKADGSVEVPVPLPPSPEQVQAGISALQHLAEHRALASKVARGGAGGGHAASPSGHGGAGGAASGALWTSLTSQFSKAAEAAVQGVKGLLGVAAHSLLNEIVAAAVDNKAHERLGETAVFDAMGGHPGAMPPSARPKSDGGLITFVVGGGSMSEYHDHQKWAAKRRGRGAGTGPAGRSGPASGGGMGQGGDTAPGSKYALYGATDMVSAEAFLQQLAALGAGK